VAGSGNCARKHVHSGARSEVEDAVKLELPWTRLGAANLVHGDVEWLLEEFLKPLGIGQTEAARRLGISLNRLNEIVLGKRGITADTALRLARLLETSPQFWMRLQADLGPASRTAAGGASSVVSAPDTIMASGASVGAMPAAPCERNRNSRPACR